MATPIIHKYPLTLGRSTLLLREGARVLSVQMQRGQPMLWALVDPTAPLVEQIVYGVPTGVPLTFDPEWADHLGTVQDADLVWHWFAYLPPDDDEDIDDPT
jgi:hypothetical protein